MTDLATELAAMARKLHSTFSGNHPTVHCNRMPVWDEIGRDERAQWLAVAQYVKADLDAAEAQNAKMAEALTRLRDCDWVISLPDRMDAVRDIARTALENLNPTIIGGESDD